MVALKGLNAAAALGLSSIMCCRLVLSLRSMTDPNHSRVSNVSGMPNSGSHARSNDRHIKGTYKLSLPIGLERETIIAIGDGSPTLGGDAQRPVMGSRSVTLPTLPYPARSRRISLTDALNDTDSLEERFRSERLGYPNTMTLKVRWRFPRIEVAPAEETTLPDVADLV